MIKAKEYSFLVEQLKGIQERPKQYGEPEAIKVVVKHVFYSCLLLQQRNRLNDDMDSLWKSIESHLNAEGEAFIDEKRVDQINARDWVDQRSWGNKKEEISLYIVSIYQRMWDELKDELSSEQFYTTISSQIDNLLRNKSYFTNPDITAMVYRNLIGFSLDDRGYQIFLDKYVLASQKEHRGDSALGLLNIGLQSSNPPIFNQWDDMYLDIVSMIQNALSYLENPKMKYS